MSGRLPALTAIVTAALFLCASCRREKTAPPDETPSGVPPVSVSLKLPEISSQVTEAVAHLHDAERAWLAQSTEAAAAFARANETQAAYQGMLEKLGMYVGPAREREERMRAVAAARESGDAAAMDAAVAALDDAQARVEEAEAKLRLGNPPIQKAYDEWVTARKAYAGLRAAEETISKASAEVAQLTGKANDGDRDRNDDVKENEHER